MPSNVAALLSGGVSVGILAGVVSGIFYLVVAGFRWAGEVRQQSGEWFQQQLQRRLRIPAVGDAQHRGSNGSIMASESAHVREFIERLVESLVAGGLDHVNVNRLYSHPDYDRMFNTYHGALCDVLARLSFALQMAIANKPLDDSDSPSAAHAELKQLVSNVVREAMTLPALQQGLANSSADSKTPQDDVNSKTYEDILATAILNKVIDRFQQCSFITSSTTDDNRNRLNKTSDMDQQPKFISHVEIGCGTSSSSTDETGVEGSTWSESSQTGPQSLTLEECIEEEEEVTMYSSEEGEEGDVSTGAELDFYLSGLNFIKRHRVPFPELGMDIVDGREEQDGEEERCSPQPTDLLSRDDSWEDNWLFQRRKLRVGGGHHPMPVPMLVPNPSEEYRALIGDRDAEDTSDLSECSDGLFDDILEIDLMQQLMRHDATTAEEAGNLAEARNAELANSIDSSSEYGQQDSEYTEDYASATRRQMNSLTRGRDLDVTSIIWDHDLEATSKPIPTPRTRTMPLADSLVDDTTDNATRETSLADSSLLDLATPPRPGTIAEREHRKWESAVPLENNPYSSENILKRLNRSAVLDMRPNCQVAPDKQQQPGYQPKPEKTSEPAQPDVARYGRDYYVNASKSSAGCVTKNFPRPVEIIMSPTAAVHEVAETKKSEVNPAQSSEATSPHVGNEVTRLQKSINQKEQLWLKTINTNKSDPEPKIDNNLYEVTNGSDINVCGKSYEVDAPVVVVRRQQKPKLENSTCKNLKNGLLNVEASTENNAKRQEPSKQLNGIVVSSKTVRVSNGDVKLILNGSKKKSVSLTSGGSSASSDSELTIAMPSVRDLAKQFAARTTSSSSPSKSPSPISRSPTSPVTKKQQSSAMESMQPMREVHSLTARSISRVFREELKRNPAPPDSSDCSHSQVSSSDACYTSDESSTSPTPGSLRNNIQFWEKLNK